MAKQINKIIIQGRLTRDPEYNAEKGYTRYTLANDRYNKDANFVDCITFNEAEFASKYLHKGSLIIVEGELNIDKYTTKEGTTGKSTTIKVNNHYFASSKSENATPAPENNNTLDFLNTYDDAELPFV